MVIPRPERSCLLTVNGGSSSLKFAVFPRDLARSDPAVARGTDRADRPAGRPGGHHRSGQRGTRADDGRCPRPAGRGGLAHRLAGAAHRLARDRWCRPSRRAWRCAILPPERVTAEMLAELRRITPMDPDHLPGEIAVIERFQARLPELPQVACFDTAFHHDMPRVAQIVPIPRRFESSGVRRYGFHGLSYAYLMEALSRVAGPEVASGRVILAHLGNGASLAAVRDGRSIDTTMALTPAAGLVMGTRPGDIDPGLPGFLARAEGVTVDQFDAMINHAVRAARRLRDQLRYPRPPGEGGPGHPRRPRPSPCSSTASRRRSAPSPPRWEDSMSSSLPAASGRTPP